MPYTTLISTAELADHLDDPNWAIVDCRFDLGDTEAGRRKYQADHIPGAIYAHLDQDLSGPIIPGKTGRHPLPAVAAFVETLSRWGIDDKTQVVVYDDAGGLIAGRLWWMLRWMGHDAVALLDGGFRLWQQGGRPVTAGVDSRAPRSFVADPRPDLLAGAEEVHNNLENDDYLLLDARDEARYRGEVAGMDPVAGHIPGALSAWYGHNLAPDGRFLPLDELRARYVELLGDPEADEQPGEIIFYCGSGVSAAHDLLAMEHAGLGEARLYVGSWSDWINDPERPVATGEEA